MTERGGRKKKKEEPVQTLELKENGIRRPGKGQGQLTKVSLQHNDTDIML